MTLKGENKRLLRIINNIRNAYGEIHDIVGGFGSDEKFWELLQTDSQAVKNTILKSLVVYFFDSGYDDVHGIAQKFNSDDAQANTLFLSSGCLDGRI